MATKTFTGTGLASATARWSGGTLPIAGDNIVIAAGADCTLDGAYSWGNGTSSTTLASNGILVSGTLRGHATTPWSLTCVGSIVQGAGSSVIFDQSAGSGTLILNSGGTAGQHGFVTLPGAGSCATTIKGIPRTRNTALSAPASSNTIQVTASVGWAIGDSVVIASPDDNPANSTLTTITGGSSPNWTLAVSVTRSAGCAVGNLSSNMVVKSATTTLPGVFALQAQTGSMSVTAQNIRFENIGWTGGWTGAAQTGAQFLGVGLQSNTRQVVQSCAHEWTHGLSTQTQGTLFSSVGASANYGDFVDCAGYSNAASGFGFLFANVSLSNSSDCNIYRCNVGFATFTSAGAYDVNLIRGKIWAADRLCNLTSSINPVTCTDVEHHAVNYVATYSGGKAKYIRGSVSVGSRMLLHTLAAATGVEFVGTTFGGVTLTAGNTFGSMPSQVSRSRLQAVNGVDTDNRDYSYYRNCYSDTSTSKRGTYSVKIQPQVANTAIIYTFTLPAVSGVAQVIKGSLRFDVTYGAATPPVIALSGQGVTASYTCAAIADVWDDFTLSFTPTSTGDITVTITVQSASTAGYAWLDGVYHYPMIQAVRHWGYQWLPQAAQLVDARITLTEAAALALPVAVNHSLSTVTITGAVTPSEALQAMLADLVQTANNSRPVHVTGDGSTFATSYTVVLSGSGAVSGPYADAGGLHVSITSSALDAGTLVQVWDVAAATELYIGTPSGALSLPIVYPGADKTLRLRAMQCGASAASLFIEQLGTLTSAGASFLVTQSPDSVYAANAIDGSAVTGITIDDTLMRFVLSGRTSISWAEIYAYEAWWLSTVAGMRDDGRIITAIDPANYVLAGFQLRNDNPGGAPITLTGGWGRDSVTGQTVTLIDTTGGPIFAAPDAVISYGQSAATPAEIWSHASRTLTADPGAAGHAATQAAIAAVQSVAQAARDQAALAVALSA